VASRITITTYADFKQVVGALTAGKVFVQHPPSVTYSYLWFVSTDGNFIVTTIPFQLVLPDSFAADFPAAITLDPGQAPQTPNPAIPTFFTQGD
jgi:hypothetical protein